MEHVEETLIVVNNKDGVVLCLRTIRLIVAPWKFNVLKSSIFALEALVFGQIFDLRTSNFCRATIS